MSAEGVPVDDPVEREAFAAHMRKRHAYEYVYWNGAGQPSAKRPNTPYGEGWVPCDEQWAAWLGRAALPASTADAREAQIRAEVIEECAKVCEEQASSFRETLARNEGAGWGGYDEWRTKWTKAAEVAENLGGAIRALAAKSGGERGPR